MKIGGIEVEFKPEFGNQDHLRIIKLMRQTEADIQKLEEKKKTVIDIERLEKKIESAQRQLMRMAESLKKRNE